MSSNMKRREIEELEVEIGPLPLAVMWGSVVEGGDNPVGCDNDEGRVVFVSSRWSERRRLLVLWWSESTGRGRRQRHDGGRDLGFFGGVFKKGLVEG